MRLYEQSQKNTTGSPNLAADTTITSPDVNQNDLTNKLNFQNPRGNTNTLISAATFSDSKMRPVLQAYYESKQTELNEFINGHKVDCISFSKWLEFSSQSFSDDDSGTLSIKAAQQNVDNVKQNSPDGSSNVKMTFSNNGNLFAYIDSNGGLVTHTIGGLDSPELTQKADALGLSGQKRIDYLADKIKASLSSRHLDFKVSTYSDKNIPTNREFLNMWYPNRDIDVDYKNTMNAAMEMLHKAQESHNRFEQNIFEIQEFMLKSQKSTA
jgi:hypothetical protein